MGRLDIREEETTKDMQVVIGRYFLIEFVQRGVIIENNGGTNVEEVFHHM